MNRFDLTEEAIRFLPNWLPFYKISSIVDTLVDLRSAGADRTEDRIFGVVNDLRYEGVRATDIAATTLMFCEAL